MGNLTEARTLFQKTLEWKVLQDSETSA